MSLNKKIETTPTKNPKDKDVQSIKKFLVDTINQINSEIGEIDPSAYISEYRLDSLIVSEMISTMNKHFGFNLDASVLFEKSTLRELAEYLAGVSTKPTASKEEAGTAHPYYPHF